MLSGILGIACFLLLYFLFKYRNEMKQKSVISFCMEKDLNVEIGFMQRRLSCDDKYLVPCNDENIKFILKCFQWSIAVGYYSTVSEIRIEKNDFENHRKFFEDHLAKFLEENERSSFEGRNMYEIGKDSKQVLSELGLAYFRLSHTVMLACNGSKGYIQYLEEQINIKLNNDAIVEAKPRAKRKTSKSEV